MLLLLSLPLSLLLLMLLLLLLLLLMLMLLLLLLVCLAWLAWLAGLAGWLEISPGNPPAGDGGTGRAGLQSGPFKTLTKNPSRQA